jgi:hypothetical protein
MKPSSILLLPLLLFITSCQAAPTPMPPTLPPPTATAPPAPPPATAIVPVTLTLTITDNECTFAGPSIFPHAVLSINVMMNEQKQTESGYALVTLKEGKTIEDLKAYPSAAQPDWVSLIHGVHEYTNGLHTYTYDYTKVATNPPLYLVCFNSDPVTGAWIKRAAFGPFELK